MNAYLKERTYCEGLAAVTQRFISFTNFAKPPLFLIPLPPPPSLSSTIIALIRCCVFGLSGKFVLLLITVVTGHSPVSCWDLIIKKGGRKKGEINEKEG